MGINSRTVRFSHQTASGVELSSPLFARFAAAAAAAAAPGRAAMRGRDRALIGRAAAASLRLCDPDSILYRALMATAAAFWNGVLGLAAAFGARLAAAAALAAFFAAAAATFAGFGGIVKYRGSGVPSVGQPDPTPY